MEVGDGAITVGSGRVDTGALRSTGTAIIIETGIVTGSTDIVPNDMKVFMASMVAANRETRENVQAALWSGLAHFKGVQDTPLSIDGDCSTTAITKVMLPSRISHKSARCDHSTVPPGALGAGDP